MIFQNDGRVRSAGFFLNLCLTLHKLCNIKILSISDNKGDSILKCKNFSILLATKIKEQVLF